MWRKWKRKKFPPDVRLTFSFLLSGEDTNLAGLVTYSVDELVGFTGLSESRLRKAMTFLVDSGRVLWDELNDLILLVRWIKHNPVNNPKHQSGAINSISVYENHPFHEIAVSLINGANPDTLSIPYAEGMHTPQGQGQGQGDLNKRNSQKTDSLIVLGFLNKTTGRNFSRSKDIETCFKREKCTVEDCQAIIRFKWGEWAGTEMAKHLNPTTPFRKDHFQSYLDESRAGPLPAITKRTGFDGPDNRSERNRSVMEKKLKEFSDAEDNQSIDGGGCDLQRTAELGSDGRLPDGPREIS